uniref:Uncharacterized protein n=1 Tax=Urocitellus parryii TaxID=9999 RepID=A0A8D2HLA6_UROPR
LPGIIPVKDVNKKEFIRVLAAFLKKSRKLKVLEWVDRVQLAKHKQLAPYKNWFFTSAVSISGGITGTTDSTVTLTFQHHIICDLTLSTLWMSWGRGVSTNYVGSLSFLGEFCQQFPVSHIFKKREIN